MCDACNKADAVNFQIESPWVDLSQVQQKRISELEKVLEWYATEFLYDMESFTTTAPLNVVGEVPNNIQINKNPIMHDRGKKARAVLEEK